jgi:hypothetical protein
VRPGNSAGLLSSSLCRLAVAVLARSFLQMSCVVRRQFTLSNSHVSNLELSSHNIPLLQDFPPSSVDFHLITFQFLSHRKRNMHVSVLTHSFANFFTHCRDPSEVWERRQQAEHADHGVSLQLCCQSGWWILTYTHTLHAHTCTLRKLHAYKQEKKLRFNMTTHHKGEERAERRF